MKVKNMISDKTGRAISNQFIIEDNSKTYFQSYNTVIAMKEGKKIIIDDNAENYSRTTSKYLYKFLGMDKKHLLEGVKAGRIIRENLNV